MGLGFGRRTPYFPTTMTRRGVGDRDRLPLGTAPTDRDNLVRVVEIDAIHAHGGCRGSSCRTEQSDAPRACFGTTCVHRRSAQQQVNGRLLRPARRRADSALGAPPPSRSVFTTCLTRPHDTDEEPARPVALRRRQPGARDDRNGAQVRGSRPGPRQHHGLADRLRGGERDEGGH